MKDIETGFWMSNYSASTGISERIQDFPYGGGDPQLRNDVTDW